MKGVAALGYSPHEGHLPLPHEPAWHAAPQVPPVWAAPPLPGVEGTHSPLLFSLEETQEHITLPSRANSDFFTAVQQELALLQAHPAAGLMQDEIQIQTKVHAVAENSLWLEIPPAVSGAAVSLALESHAPEEVPLPHAFPPALNDTTQQAELAPIADASQPMPCPASQSPLEIAHGLNAQYEAPCPAQPQLEDSGALLLAQTVLAV